MPVRREGTDPSELPQYQTGFGSISGIGVGHDLSRKLRPQRSLWMQKIGSRRAWAIAASLSGLIFACVLLLFRGHGVLSASRPVTATAAMVLDAAAEEAAESRRPLSWQTATTLVVVAGHAVYTGNAWTSTAIRNESNWYLEDYQRGLVDTFLAHIERGVDLVRNDSSAILIFSGGVTRPGVGPRSEGSSYWLAAEGMDWFGHSDSVPLRAHVEEFARDSLENLLFSICRFHQLTGRYPHEIKVVSFVFKETRFNAVHRRAIRFPDKRFHFHGIDPPGAKGMRDSLYAVERSKTLGPYSRDLYGCNDRSLYKKRLDRNPSLLYHPYPQGCPELSALFSYCGRNLFSGPLPWDPRVDVES
jgi:hypothetical protein